MKAIIVHILINFLENVTVSDIQNCKNYNLMIYADETIFNALKSLNKEFDESFTYTKDVFIVLSPTLADVLRNFFENITQLDVQNCQKQNLMIYSKETIAHSLSILASQICRQSNY